MFEFLIDKKISILSFLVNQMLFFFTKKKNFSRYVTNIIIFYIQKIDNTKLILYMILMEFHHQLYIYLSNIQNIYTPYKIIHINKLILELIIGHYVTNPVKNVFFLN
jgi:hypothetical protein